MACYVIIIIIIMVNNFITIIVLLVVMANTIAVAVTIQTCYVYLLPFFLFA